MKKLLLGVMGLMVLFALNVNAQNRNCVTHEKHLEQLNNNPKYAHRQAQIEQATRRFVDNPQQRVSGNQIIIPCIVHVVYANSQENISDAQIQSQIDRLNLDYSATNSDYSSVPSEFTSVRSGDTDIRFELIETKRYSDSRSTWGTNDAVKQSYPPIEPDRILNMWVADIGGGILGYAQFPGGDPSTDGVVMSPQYFGDASAAGGSGFYLDAPFNLGRTATHEVGHWLNLRHIWGDGNCNADDFVSDTPAAGGPNYGCPSAGTNSCPSQAGNDMFMNYMDYVDDACMFMFSAGQDSRMQATFQSGGGREGFLLDPVYVPGGNPPPVSCSTTSTTTVTLTLVTDNYGSETSWTLKDESGSTVASGSGYGNNQTYTETFNLNEEAYTFTINDSYGDGICCSYGNGSYELRDSDNKVVKSGGSFTSSEATTFCAEGGGTPPASCDTPTGLSSSNVGETTFTLSWNAVSGADSYDVDINGTVLNATSNSINVTGAVASTTYTCAVRTNCSSGSSDYSSSINVTTNDAPPTGGNQVIFQDYFESGFGNWNDGGSDCARYSGSRSYEGSYSIRLRDNTNTSTMTTDAFSASGYDAVEVEFYFYAWSMENNEDFWLQYSGNGGSSWTTVQSWASGTNFENGNFYTATVTINSGLTNNAKLRFRCDASGNSDYIYVDQVTVTGISGAKLAKNSVKQLHTLRGEVDLGGEENDFELDGVMKLFPNPANAVLNISLDELDGTSVEIYNISGQLVKRTELNAAKSAINVSDLKAGVYVVKAINKEGTYTERFVKQ